MRILSVFGTRPEAIKLAPVIRELRLVSPRVESKVCVTGQHREMLNQVLDLFKIVPDYDLKVMKTDQSPSDVASSVLSELPSVLAAERPDWVLVQGDTTTVAATSLAAFYAHTRVGHIEAGLRTYDKWRPFPEEINRRVATVVADLHFAPTPRSRVNLLQEGVPDDSIFVTGNPVIDALHWVATLPCPLKDRSLAEIPWERRIIMVTAHRRENHGEGLRNICLALKEIADSLANEAHIVYPLHLNPQVWDPVRKMLGDTPNLTLTSPLPYLSLVNLMKRSYLVLTDSGGLQEEAPGLGKPVLVLRDVTERPEAVEAGTVRLVGTDVRRIVSETHRLFRDTAAYEQMARAVNPYGDGHSGKRIVEVLLSKRR